MDLVTRIQGSGDDAALTRPLLATDDVVVGAFNCPPGNGLWRSINHIGYAAVLAFPGTPVVIDRAGIGPICADRNQVVVYAPGQEYRRAQLDPRGDVCSFVGLSDRLLSDLLLEGRRIRPVFSAGRVPVPPRVWMAYHVVLAQARQRRLRAFALEERVLEIVGRTLDVVAPIPGSDPTRPIPRIAARRIEQIRELLSADLDSRKTVAELAAAVGVSPFHLARQFKAQTGATLHAYRTQLRLRAAAAEVLADPEQGISDVAARTGFASHSHLTARFGRAFGVPPSNLRPTATLNVT